jgi:pimeloyl-ACP methyl ester carboxylesterase
VRPPPTARVVTGGAVAGLTAAGAVAYAAARPRKPRAEPTTPEPPEGLPPGRTVDVPGVGELFVRDTGEAGDAPTLVLLHGWMFPADANWFTSYASLSSIGRVIGVDHRGHGRGLRSSEPFRLAAAADDVAALLRHLGTGPAVAVGYSMGGPIAQLLWQRNPDVVSGMVLCATSAAFASSPKERRIWYGMGALQLALRLAPRGWWERGLLAQVQGKLPIGTTAMINEQTPESVRRLLPWIFGELARNDPEDIAEAGRELGRYDARGWLPSVDVPTAVVVTTRDRLVPAQRQRRMAGRIPGSVTYEADGYHDLVVSGPEVFVPVRAKAVLRVLTAA